LGKDPGETTNLAAQHVDIVKRLDAAARQTREATHALRTQP
jgi:hypothetical protein